MISTSNLTSSGFWQWWQTLPGRIDPVFLHIGPVELRYYGLMYVAAFLTVYALTLRRMKRETYPFSADVVSNYFTFAILGVVIGGRLGYVLFYDLSHYLQRPAEILWPFSPDGRFTGIAGMSYHGGVLGLFAVSVYFCKCEKIRFWQFADLVVPAMPLGYMFGRIGNFLNGELYGRPTQAVWGMVFPSDPSKALRHPSQLYEAFLEGAVLFALLWPLRNRRPFDGYLVSLYLIGYGVARFFIEFVREPDAQLGLIWGPFTMGQALCAAMIAAGLVIAAIGSLKAKTRRL